MCEVVPPGALSPSATSAEHVCRAEVARNYGREALYFLFPAVLKISTGFRRPLREHEHHWLAASYSCGATNRVNIRRGGEQGISLSLSAGDASVSNKSWSRQGKTLARQNKIATNWRAEKDVGDGNRCGVDGTWSTYVIRDFRF